MSTVRRVALAGTLAGLAMTAGAQPAAAAAAPARATVLVLEPGATGTSEREAARSLLTGRAARGPVAVLLTSRPATVLVPPTRSPAALRAGLADAPARTRASTPEAAADAVLSLSSRVSSTPPAVVLAGPATTQARALALAVEGQARAAGAPVQVERLDAALARDRAAAPAATAAPQLSVRRTAASAAGPAAALSAPGAPVGLIGLAAAFSALAAGLALRSRPAGASVATTRITAWTAQPTGTVVVEPEEEELSAPVVPGGLLGRVHRSLTLTDLQVGAGTFVLRTVLVTAVLTALTFLVVAPLALVPLVGVPLLVRSTLRRLVRKRRTKFAEQLGDTVQAIASAMRAGHGITSAISMLVDDLPEPSRSELRAVVSADRIGVPFDEALGDAVARMDSRDLEQVALVASLQRDTGGNGAEALDRVVETIRARDDVRRLIATLTAQGRMARWVLTALPVGLTLTMLVIGDGYLAPLIDTAVGRVISLGGLGLLALGSWWIGRLVEIDV